MELSVSQSLNVGLSSMVNIEITYVNVSPVPSCKKKESQNKIYQKVMIVKVLRQILRLKYGT